VAKDRYTIVDYWATWGPPCVDLAPQIEDFAKARSDVYVHKVNATTWEVADWKHYLPEVDGLPVIDIFGPDQKLVRRLVGEEARKFKAVIPPPAVSAR
jgi:thiol-disulfide isomerase/thioredoxin